MTDRTYTEEEVKRLIKRATELEVKRRGESGGMKAEEGLTLDEITSAASEAGIDPELVRKAASELETSSDKEEIAGKEGARGKEIYAERWLNHIPGRENLDAIIADLDHRYREGRDDEWWRGGKPKVNKTGSAIEWIHIDEWEIYERRVLLQPQGERFRIRVSKRLAWGGTWGNNFTDMLQYLPYLLAAGVVFAGYLLDSFLIGIVLAAVLFILLYPFLKKYNQRSVEKHKEEVVEIADEISEQLLLMSDSESRENPIENLGKDSGTIEIPKDTSGDEENPLQQKNRLKNNR